MKSIKRQTAAIALQTRIAAGPLIIAEQAKERRSHTGSAYGSGPQTKPIERCTEEVHTPPLRESPLFEAEALLEASSSVHTRRFTQDDPRQMRWRSARASPLGWLVAKPTKRLLRPHHPPPPPNPASASPDSPRSPPSRPPAPPPPPNPVTRFHSPQFRNYISFPINHFPSPNFGLHPLPVL